MKIKEIKTSLSVYFAGSERFHFASGISHLHPHGLELIYQDKPEGVIVKTKNAEVWVNLANISYMKFFEETAETEGDVSRETIKKRGRPAKVDTAIAS
jgi:hypothetical protein